MKSANGSTRLSAELLTTADALRHVRSRLEELVHMGHPALVSSHDVIVLLVETPIVATALQDLAESLAITE